MKNLLGVAIPTYNDYRGLSMTVQSLSIHHGSDLPITVLDNYGKCEATKKFCEASSIVKYVVDDLVSGTAYAKNRAIAETDAKYVLLMDSHVTVNAVGIDRLKAHVAQLPKDNQDMFHGCLVNDRKITATELSPAWSSQMWGTWLDRTEGGKVPLPPEPFEVWGHGCGLFCINKSQWPGFHSRAKGFGGEEGAIQEHYRQRGGKVFTLPFLQWTHSFHLAGEASHVILVEDKLRNYLLAFTGLDNALKLQCDCMLHFLRYLPLDKIKEIASECLPKGLDISCSLELSRL